MQGIVRSKRRKMTAPVAARDVNVIERGFYMAKTRGRVTLPSEAGFLEETKEMMERWGADALRDSDGTKLPQEVKALDAAVYTTYFVARGHNEFAKEHMEECQQMYLMSRRVTAVSSVAEIPFMEGYFGQQVVPDYVHDCKRRLFTSIRCLFWFMPSGILLRCTITLPTTGEISPMRFPLMCASRLPRYLPGST